MLRLIPFELSKIWRKRRFALSICVLLLFHLFLLWYTSLPNEERPPLSAYKALCTELHEKSEEEKGEYIAKSKDKIDGLCFVQNILFMQSMENEMGTVLTEQELQNHPGVFEKYYELYQTNGYLKFTDSLEQEQAFINEIYAEWQKAAGYGEYLRSIRENKDTLSKTSIFSRQNQNSYSARNLQKSAADHAKLSEENIRFTPSKGLVSAMENIWAELLLVLGMMLFVGSLITDEKNKKLFFITRSTRYGVLHSIAAKITALFIHCILLTALFYTISLVFWGQSTGWFVPDASLQSIAAYTESSLPVSVLGYVLISVLTKALILFGIGAVLTVFCIGAGTAVLPFLTGSGIIGISALLYYLIPAGSVFSVFKYLNPVGLMKTENIYGRYLNFNLFGYPVSRLGLSLLLILLICVFGIVGSLLAFCRMQSFEMRKMRLPFPVLFHPHTNIFRHEIYKLLITSRALPILLLFAALLTYESLGRSYTLSVSEQYYQDIMTELEGGLTDEKESLILSEKARYEDALQKIEQIDKILSTGELSVNAADTLKSQANMTLAFYPAFQRAEAQYDHIKTHGGRFVYDTGYLYLFGVLEDSFSIDFLILSIGTILAVSGATAMEYQNGSLFLIGATRAGKRKIMLLKILICSITAAVLALVPIPCRIYRISAVYPMHSLSAAVQNISRFNRFSVPMPIVCFGLLLALFQILSMVLVALLTMAISIWRKNQVQTIFSALLFLVVPITLKLLGFEIAKWFSLYPLYGWTELL
ncbi:MAG: hypothetical protein NC123_14760 [Butyrivibrio sp.]|nr:hypothetical protein [Ruminococcus flavefaciens]MCM1560780.1 hypothetical protein [Butyrivibrio sp.]